MSGKVGVSSAVRGLASIAGFLRKWQPARRTDGVDGLAAHANSMARPSLCMNDAITLISVSSAARF
jgi:hypothetical protein